MLKKIAPRNTDATTYFMHNYAYVHIHGRVNTRIHTCMHVVSKTETLACFLHIHIQNNIQKPTKNYLDFMLTSQSNFFDPQGVVQAAANTGEAQNPQARHVYRLCSCVRVCVSASVSVRVWEGRERVCACVLECR
jgi:hypothetical protein